MKKQNWAIVSLVALCFLLLGTAVLVRSDNYKTYQRDIEVNHNQCTHDVVINQNNQSKDCQSFLYRTLEDPVAAFTAGLFIMTGALFIATFGLYAAAIRQGADSREALAITRETSKTQLRAYLSVNDAVIAQMTGRSDVIVQVKIRNFGQTPAYKVKTASRRHTLQPMLHHMMTRKILDLCRLSDLRPKSTYKTLDRSRRNNLSASLAGILEFSCGARSFIRMNLAKADFSNSAPEVAQHNLCSAMTV